MQNERLTKKVFLWDKKLNEDNILNSWYSEVKTIFSENNLPETFESGAVFDLKLVVENLQSCMIQTQQTALKNECGNKPKLRTFVRFKDFSMTPSYLTKPLSFIQRKFLAKIRLGCLEIRLETGRYARPRLAEEARTCQACPNPNLEIENEEHFLFKCSTYQTERLAWLEKLNVPNNFLLLSQNSKCDLV